MAKAPAKPEIAAPDAAQPAPKKSKLLLIIVLILVLVLIIVGAGIAFLLLLKNNKGGAGEEAAAPAAVQAPGPAKIDLTKPPVFVPLDTFTVNLTREESDHYLQTVIVLRVADATVGTQLNGFMPEIRHRINLLLSSKMPSEVSSMEGREHLAEEILKQVNTALGYNPPPGVMPGALPAAPVQGVLFNSFIIQ